MGIAWGSIIMDARYFSLDEIEGKVATKAEAAFAPFKPDAHPDMTKFDRLIERGIRPNGVRTVDTSTDSNLADALAYAMEPTKPVAERPTILEKGMAILNESYADRLDNVLITNARHVVLAFRMKDETALVQALRLLSDAVTEVDEHAAFTEAQATAPDAG